MAVSLLLSLSRPLQAPIAAFLLIGAMQLAAAVIQPSRDGRAETTFGVRGALAAAQIAPERS